MLTAVSKNQLSMESRPVGGRLAVHAVGRGDEHWIVRNGYHDRSTLRIRYGGLSDIVPCSSGNVCQGLPNLRPVHGAVLNGNRSGRDRARYDTRPKRPIQSPF